MKKHAKIIIATIAIASTVANPMAVAQSSNSSVDSSSPEASAELSAGALTDPNLSSNGSSAAQLSAEGSVQGSVAGSSVNSLGSVAAPVEGSIRANERGSSGNILGSGNSYLLGSQQQISKNAGITEIVLGALLALLTFAGNARDVIINLFKSGVPKTTPTLDPTITEAKVIKKKKTSNPRLENWTVSSPANQRNIDVEVYLPADTSVAGPAVYIYGGVNGTESSPWFSKGWADKTFADENATLFAPGGATASMFQDWQNDDPVLGKNKWETFFIDELAPAVEKEINFNGKRAAMGLSMGASGLMMNAINHTGFYNAVAAISGCYSTTDALGRSTIDLTVGTRGGNPENMWGPFGNETWHNHDVVENADKLTGTDIYLYAASGQIPNAAETTYNRTGLQSQITGTLLENGSMQCTQALSDALNKAGVAHTANIETVGAHGWFSFGPQLQPAWDAIKDSLV